MKQSFLLMFALNACLACAHEASRQTIETPPQPTYGPYDEARRTDVLDGESVRWTEISSENGFWNFLYANPRAVVLFGTRGCAPCDNAKVWWQTHGTPRGWGFGFWESRDFDSDTNFQHLATASHPEGGRFPLAVVFLNAAPRRRFYEVRQTSFADYEEVTVTLKRWLASH